MIYIIFVLSIAIHELGHVISSKIFHTNFGMIKFTLLGFSSNTSSLIGCENYKKIIIMLSGALFNIILALSLCFFNYDKLKLWIYTNLGLGIINLLPIIPLDGANVILCVLNKRFNSKKAIGIGLKISKILLIIISFLYACLIILVKNVFILFMIIYLWYLFLEENNNFKTYFRIEEMLKRFN